MEDKEKQKTSRIEYLNSLQQFIKSSVQTIQSSLDKLGWTQDKTTLQEGGQILTVCPLNSAHRISSNNLQNHSSICYQQLRGYAKDSIFLSSASGHPKGAIVLNKNLQADIILKAAAQNPLLKIEEEHSHGGAGENVWDRDVPQTSDQVFSNFTTDERRVLYDYVISNTSVVQPQLSEYSLPFWTEDKAEPMTKEQLLTAQRDAKRRRVRYRVAKVHTKSKNYSEVLREVINNQMLAYEDWLRDKNGDTETPEAVPENPQREEVKDKKPEMIWLECDFRTNPHIRWRNMLNDKDKKKNGEEHNKAKLSRKEKSRDKSWERWYSDHHKKDEKRRYVIRDTDSKGQIYQSTKHKDERGMYDENIKFKRQKIEHDELRNENRFGESKSNDGDRIKQSSHNKDIAHMKSEKEYSRYQANNINECDSINLLHGSKNTEDIETNLSKSSYKKKNKKTKKKNKHKHKKKKRSIGKYDSSTTDTD